MTKHWELDFRELDFRELEFRELEFRERKVPGTWELGNLGTSELGNLGTWNRDSRGLASTQATPADWVSQPML